MKLKFCLIIFLSVFAFVSCSDDDDYDSIDFDQRAINIWVAKTPTANMYTPLFQLKSDNTGFYYSKELVADESGNPKTVYYKNKIVSYKYTKSFGFEFNTSNDAKPPYYYIESISQDSITFIVNRYSASGSSNLKLYSKDFLDSKGYIEAPIPYVER